MKYSLLLVTFALAGASCVDSDPVTTEPAEASSQFCQLNYPASAQIGNPSPWSGVLPADQSAKQIWLSVPIDSSLQTWNLYQVDPATRKVVWWTQVDDGQRVKAGIQALQRPGSYVSIRNPPPPPWPPGDGWLHSDRVVNGALHAVGAWPGPTPPY